MPKQRPYALSSAEKKNEELTGEIGSLEFQEKKSFKAPPKEWIDHRLANLRETLSKDTVSSALALKELLSPIMLEPILTKDTDFYSLFAGEEKDFKPYYVAHTKIETLALLDEENKGSNWYHWRRVEESAYFVLKIPLSPLFPPLKFI